VGLAKQPQNSVVTPGWLSSRFADVPAEIRFKVDRTSFDV